MIIYCINCSSIWLTNNLINSKIVSVIYVEKIQLDDGWPESEERCSEICKSEDGIA